MQMSRIKEFHFIWCDAWHNIDDGFDTILETADNGNVALQCLVNLKPQKIDLTDKEDLFIRSIEECNVKSWNGKRYDNYNYEDGSMWVLDFAYDDVIIRARGMNGYPSEFVDFVETLCDKWELNPSGLSSGMKRWPKKFNKGTVVKELSDFEQSWPSYM